MAKYQCLKNSKHVFIHPAKTTTPVESEEGGHLSVGSSFVETYVCPFCKSLEFTEYIEPEVGVESVSIYEMKNTGIQTELNKLLAEGYIIKERYAGKYFLEKPKLLKEPDYIQQAQAEAAKQQ
jgi:hypothetical protein